MIFRILGPLEVSAGEAVVSLGAPKQRALLAVLLLHIGEIVPTDRLIDLLWGERPPRTAAHSIQIYVSELRKALGALGGESLLVTRQPGYQLLAGTDDVDASRFELLVQTGAALLTAGEHDAGVERLRKALALWRGPVLSDFAYEEFAQPYIRRLNDLHLDAIEQLAAADLDAGRTSQAIAPLEAAIREDPLRERSRELLMLALYRSGRHAEALHTYQRLRELLGDELGLEPSPTIARMQERILLHDPTLAPAATAVAADMTAGRNPYKGLRAFREQDAPDFFGRDALIDHLLSSLNHGQRLISLVGPSGSGKSSAVAAGFIPRLREGAIDGSADWAIAMMVPGSSPTADIDAVLARAADRVSQRRLLVIDQFEELFSLTDEAQRREFLHQLVETVTNPDGRTAVVLALRADFYDRPLLNAEFADVFVPSVVNVVPMTARELEAAVTKPAERVGVTVESALLAELVAETADRPGALPLLQYALADLFDQHVGRKLTLADYRKLGGLRGVLSRRAEAVYADLRPEEQRVTMQVFLRLVRLGTGAVDSRRRVPLSDLTDLALDPVALSKVLETFGRNRFLSFDRDPTSGRAVVDIAHEALFREWERLAGWIDRHRAALRRHATFQAALEEWESSGRDDDYLLAGSRLAEFESWSHEGVLDLTGREREFLNAGLRRREADRETEARRTKEQRALEGRARRTLIALAGTVVLLAAAMVVAFVAAQSKPRDRVAMLHWSTNDFDYPASGFDRGVTEYQLVGSEVIANGSGVNELRKLARDGNQLIMAFSMPTELFDDVARDFPDTHFVLFDEVGTEPNVTYVVFDDNESSYLAGAAAALKSTTGKIGFVGGVDIEKIWHFQAGFEAGARSTDPEIQILSTYLSPDDFYVGFNSPELGHDAAASMYDQGADIVFEAAGPSSFGAFDAAVEKSAETGLQRWVIGVDADQFVAVANMQGVTNPGPWQAHILTSVIKRWDQGFETILGEFSKRTLSPGFTSLGLESEGVGLTYSGGFVADVWPQLQQMRDQIIAGQVAVPCVPIDKETAGAGANQSCRR